MFRPGRSRTIVVPHAMGSDAVRAPRQRADAEGNIVSADSPRRCRQASWMIAIDEPRRALGFGGERPPKRTNGDQRFWSCAKMIEHRCRHFFDSKCHRTMSFTTRWASTANEIVKIRIARHAKRSDIRLWIMRKKRKKRHCSAWLPIRRETIPASRPLCIV